MTERAGGDGGTDRPASASDAVDADGHPRSIPKDDAFNLLQNARRRAVLRYLLEHPDHGAVRMRDLAEEIAAWEHDTTVRQLEFEQRQRVYIALYKYHLPKLDEHGVIRYNQSRGVVEPTPLLDVLAPFLEDGLHADTQAFTPPDGGPPT